MARSQASPGPTGSPEAFSDEGVDEEADEAGAGLGACSARTASDAANALPMRKAAKKWRAGLCRRGSERSPSDGSAGAGSGHGEVPARSHRALHALRGSGLAAEGAAVFDDMARSCDGTVRGRVLLAVP
ncbi:hypothetical protein GCM10008965_50440 [Methylorubrum aminovorans]|nr:hypothetical protein GCM10025880_46520 [Methylorubrum aminovorans]